MSAWYVLRCDGGYLGTQWAVKQNCITSPRTVVLPSLAAPLYATVTTCLGRPAWEAEARRARAILGVEFEPVPVRFVDKGPRGRDPRAGRFVDLVEDA